jgi:hypothetical protein
MEERALCHWRMDYGRRDSVNSNAFVSVFHRGRLSDSDHTMLAGVVGSSQTAANQTRDGRHIHNCSF